MNEVSMPCPQEDTVYLYVYSTYVDGFARVGERIFSGKLEVNPDWFSSSTIEKAVETQTRNGQLTLNDMHGFDWSADYELEDLKLDYPVFITQMES